MQRLIHIDSDHNPVVAKLGVKLKKVLRAFSGGEHSQYSTVKKLQNKVFGHKTREEVGKS